MEIEYIDYKYNDNDVLNFIIKHKEINGILGKKYQELIDMLKIRKNYQGTIKINGEVIDKNNIQTINKKISIVKKEFDYTHFNNTVYDLMNSEINRKHLKLKNREKKTNDSLIIVGLDETYLNRQINTLSTSEIKIIQLAIALLSNPEVLIIEDIFKYSDKNWEKKVIMLLQKIKEQYHKTIIIASEESEEIYKYTSNLIIYKNGKIIATGNTYELMQRVDFLKKNRIHIPRIVEFTYLAKKKKNIKIDYHKDVRDIIKDIYKHV